MEREDDGIENEFPQIKVKIQELDGSLEREYQSLDGLNSIQEELEKRGDIIVFKYQRLVEYYEKSSAKREEDAKKGIFPKPDLKCKVPIYIIDEVEKNLSDFTNVIDSFEKQLMIHEEDINSFPSDTEELKNKVNSFMSKNPSYSEDCYQMTKLIGEIEEKQNKLVEMLNLYKKILEKYKSSTEIIPQALTTLKETINLEIELISNNYYLHHPYEKKNG